MGLGRITEGRFFVAFIMVDSEVPMEVQIGYAALVIGAAGHSSARCAIFVRLFSNIPLCHEFAEHFLGPSHTQIYCTASL